MDQTKDLHPLVAQTRDSLKQIGYQDNLLKPNYGFSDVMGQHDRAQTIPLAAFAQEPTSYKTACFGIVLTESDYPAEVEHCRALGAPMVLALQPAANTCRIWQMMGQGEPKLRGNFPADTLAREISNRQQQWQPKEVLRAKNIAFPKDSPQLDFYDAGLIPAIEAVVHQKLNELLSTVVAQVKEVYQERNDQEPDYQALFQIIFRFIAAKLLGDRKHPGDWLNTDSSKVLRSVNAFYFPQSTSVLSLLGAAVQNRVWDTIREAFHFQNLSVEALAYVYENTFVDLETRRTLGTHATPYEVAEYMVRALPLDTLPQTERTVFEPFCGAAPFLIAALGQLRELLPEGMSAQQRHDYFVQMLTGLEMDSFAREVALHSLILADYPNSNGWRILGDDFFASSQVATALTQANIVLCNPPYSSFDAQERKAYSIASANKAVEALMHVLQRPPKMLGFVLPRVYVNGQSYRRARAKLETLYGNLDVIALPDNVFKHSSSETVLLLAYGQSQTPVRHRFVALTKPDYETFKRTRTIAWPENPLNQIWEALADNPPLSSISDIHRGIKYRIPLKDNYSSLVSEMENPGFQPGLVRVHDGFEPYVFSDFKYLNSDPKLMLFEAYKFPWHLPKLIVPAGRMSRNQWVIAAAADDSGLICTQRFLGIWPKTDAPPLNVLAATLNGPVANAWLSRHRSGRDNQVRFVQSIPVPAFSVVATELITRYVNRYVRLQGTAEALDILLKIDAAVLNAYGLSDAAERELLALFDGAQRPGVPNFTGYGQAYEQAQAEYRRELMDAVNQRRIQLIRKKPLSSDESRELKELQAQMSAYVNTQYPLPFAGLERLEEFAKRLQDTEIRQ